MVSNMKKTLAGLALAALPLMASAQMEQMQDSALANVNGQLGIIDVTTLGFDINLLGPVGAPLIGLPFTRGGEAIIDLRFRDHDGIFDVLPNIGPDLFNLPNGVFKTGFVGGFLGGIVASVGTIYILQNGLTLPVLRLNPTVTNVTVI